jgi:hypothetical protein
MMGLGVAGAGCAMDDMDVGSTQSALTNGGVIGEWNVILTQQAFGNNLRHARMQAMMHAAQHDAVNGASPRYAQVISGQSDPSADPTAAAAAAAHGILVYFFPSNQANLDAALANSLLAVPDGPAEDAGVALGAAVAQDVIAARSTDGFSVPDPFVPPPPGPGVWEPTPPAFAGMAEPQYQNLVPFLIESRDQWAPPDIPSMSSSRYATDYNEVKLYGRFDSTARSADETAYAHFWYEGSQIGWTRIGRIVSDQLGYDLHDTARLLAMLAMSMSDGYTVGWYYKRLTAFWRPITAIRRGDTDGNPNTDPDAAWAPLRNTTTIPEYPSTHSVLGGAASEVLRQVTGRDDVTFCMTSTTAVPAGSVRCWNSFTQAQLENEDSRVKVGIHFRFSTDNGGKLGEKIGRWANAHNAL